MRETQGSCHRTPRLPKPAGLALERRPSRRNVGQIPGVAAARGDRTAAVRRLDAAPASTTSPLAAGDLGWSEPEESQCGTAAKHMRGILAPDSPAWVRLREVQMKPAPSASTSPCAATAAGTDGHMTVKTRAGSWAQVRLMPPVGDSSAPWGVDQYGIARTIDDSELVGQTRLITNATRPSLTVHLPSDDLKTGTAMVICPGGGHHRPASCRDVYVFPRGG